MHLLDPPVLADDHAQLLALLAGEDAVAQDVDVELVGGIVCAT